MYFIIKYFIVSDFPSSEIPSSEIPSSENRSTACIRSYTFAISFPMGFPISYSQKGRIFHIAYKRVFHRLKVIHKRLQRVGIFPVLIYDFLHAGWVIPSAELISALMKLTHKTEAHRVTSIIRTRFFGADFRQLIVKILVNPTGFTAFCALI